MRKYGMLVVCGLALTLGACQSQEKEAAKPKGAEMSLQQKEKKEDSILLEGNWKPEIHQRLQKLIEEYGVKSSAYDKDQKPYAVFDWDNTTVINDIGEATLTYQIEHLAFKMTPDAFEAAIRKDVPLETFGEELRNKEGQDVSIEEIAADLRSDYEYLYSQYKGFESDKSLEAVKKSNEYKDFSSKLRYLYEAIGDTFSSDISYPWVTYLYAGMTSEEVQELAKKSIEVAHGEELTKETWTSPESLKGQAGQVSVDFKRGVRSVPEMQNLYQTLMANGIDVYVNSASYIDVIIPYATSKELGYGVPEDHVYAMRLAKDEEGKIQAQLDENYPQTQGEGKTETINNFMAVHHGGQAPLLIGGDSNGDYAMLKDFPDLQVGLIFNLLRDPEKGIGLLATEAINTMDQEERLYYLQGRDENKGVLRKSSETVKLSEKEARLQK